MQMHRQSPQRCRYLHVGVLVFLLALVSAIFYISPEVRFWTRLFDSAFRHGAVNRRLGRTYLPPTFEVQDPLFLWRIEAPASAPANPLIPPKPSFDEADGELYFKWTTTPPSLRIISLRVFQSGYWLGWNWRICLIVFVALACMGVLYRIIIFARRRGKALNSLGNVRT